MSFDTMSEARRLEVIKEAQSLPRVKGVTAWVGKLWFSKRRFAWAIRYDSEARKIKGCRWEPVQEII